MPALRPLLEQRVARKLRSWPQAVADDVAAYLGQSRSGAGGPRDDGERLWSMLPRWLLDDRRFAAAAHRRRGWLDDILWAQYCLFLFVRIHDDLFDGQTQKRSLLFVADELLVESESTLARHISAGPFWQLFRESVATTLQGILKVDACQQRPGAMSRRSLALYADVSAIFKVGTAAVTVGSGRMREFRHLGRFSDEMAIAEQILDDLFDVEEDLARERYNFAANRLLGGDPARVAGRADRLAREVLFGDGVSALLQTVHQHLDRAGAAIAPLRLAPAARYVDAFRRGVDELRKQVHAARVAHIFRNVRVGPSSPNAAVLFRRPRPAGDRQVSPKRSS